jgi:hypothetical protein
MHAVSPAPRGANQPPPTELTPLAGHSVAKKQQVRQNSGIRIKIHAVK